MEYLNMSSTNIKRILSILASLISLMCIFNFFFASKEGSTPMLEAVDNVGELSNKNYLIDVTDIVKPYLPLGNSYAETLKLLKQNGITSIVPVKRDELLNPKLVSGREYLGLFSFSSRLATSNRYLQIYLVFSEEDKLTQLKATYRLSGL